jgi:phosphohistidine phosphatase
VSSQKTLYILRHAKAEVGKASQEDHSRVLVERGINAAQIMGAYLFKQGIHPDIILCSDAARTRETWENMQDIFTHDFKVEYLSKLYLAAANEMITCLEKQPEEARSIMLIGHSPGVHQLCLKLAKNGDEDVMDDMFLKFPTCAFAAIDLHETSWTNTKDALGTLTDFVTPKMLAGIED